LKDGEVIGFVLEGKVMPFSEPEFELSNEWEESNSDTAYIDSYSRKPVKKI
jgi:hypothetical protein